MATPQLGNCRKCGKLFLQIRQFCDMCYQRQEDDYQKIISHLRNNSSCTIQELSDATGVSIKQIREFILANRITLSELPNMSYSCQTCGTPITTGTNCLSCLSNFSNLAKKIENNKPEPHENDSKTFLRAASRL